MDRIRDSLWRSTQTSADAAAAQWELDHLIDQYVRVRASRRTCAAEPFLLRCWGSGGCIAVTVRMLRLPLADNRMLADACRGS